MHILTRFLKPYWPLALLSLGCLALGSFADLMMPNLMSYVVNEGILGQNVGLINFYGLLMVGAAALNLVARLLNSFLSSRVSTGMSRDIRSALFYKVQTFESSETIRFGTSSLITRSTTDVDQLQHFTGMFMRMGITAPIMAVGGAFMAFSKSPKLAAVLIVTLPVLILSILTVSRMALPLTRSMLLKVDRVNLVMREKLTGVRVIRAFGTEDYEQGRFDHANRDLTDTAIKTMRIMSAMHPIMHIALNLTSVFIVYLGAVEASYGGIAVGDIMAVSQYVGQIMGSAMMISMAFTIWPRTSASAQRIDEVLSTQSAVQSGARDATPLAGRVGFSCVSFRYPGADRCAVEDVSFEALPGQTTAIIGSTGSGKSTLVSLLLRFYDPTEGSLTLDGVDIRELSLPSYRKKLGYVPQRALLFSGSAAENIRMGRLDATDAQVEQAAQIAQAADFIMEREEGYDTRIEQGGANLSGGQKQRMSIARALARRPDVYIFDDSFSALDFQTDARLRRALREVTDQAAVIIVAQRVSTIMDADHIVVLDEGRVAGQGRHDDLLRDCKVYREIVRSQLSEEEVAGL
jgi:ATP-binding cassette subfamily B multidrug efflux pump